MNESELRERLAAAHSEALQVGDSPARADRLAVRLPEITAALSGSGLGADTQARIRDALGSAERVLRRDDDGREAARHLQAAMSLVTPRTRKPSPFLDDEDE